MAEAEEELEGQVHFHGEEPCAEEAGGGVEFAAAAGARVNHLAGDGDGLGRVGPVEGQVELLAQRLEEGRLAGVLAVDEVALAGEAEGGDETRVDRSSLRDPGVVGPWEAGR